MTFSSYSLQGLYHGGVSDLSMAFYASTEMVIWFLSVSPFIWPVTFRDLRVLNLPCICRTKPMCSFWYMPEFDLQLFYWGFLDLCSTERSVFSAVVYKELGSWRSGLCLWPGIPLLCLWSDILFVNSPIDPTLPFHMLFIFKIFFVWVV